MYEQLFYQIIFIAKGLVLTLQLLIGGVFLGIVVGSAVAVCSHLRIFKWFFRGFISIIRGTPVILQLSFVYFMAPSLGLKLSILASGILTLGINSSAYVAEILRSGIENLPLGQFEAAKTLQIPTFYMWKDIIFPQVIKNILPSLVNEIIALLKETALISIIGGMDIMRSSQMVSAETFTYFMPLLIAGAYYYMFVFLIERTGKFIENRGKKC